MQNKGFVRVFAILLTLVCVFYLSFSFVTRHYTCLLYTSCYRTEFIRIFAGESKNRQLFLNCKMN